MDINDLTLKQIKEIQSLSCLATPTTEFTSSNLLDDYIGKYVIVRSRNEGINAGFVKVADETGIVLKEARRIWYHKPKDKNQCWYEGVANTGLSKDSKISAPVEEKVIIEDYSITLCSKEGRTSISGHATTEQN